MSLVKQIVVCAVLLAGAAAGWFAYRNPEAVGLAGAATTSDQTANGGSAQPGASARIPGVPGAGGAMNVITAPVEASQNTETAVALGTAKAARSVTLYPQVTGLVTEVLFTPGEAVAAG